ncbi:hypothetical protein TNCV_1857381 [Trichonephila clavipes]|nr:hypothetical protein TNCV_1857381 [Trichonephila clavipes]
MIRNVVFYSPNNSSALENLFYQLITYRTCLISNLSTNGLHAPLAAVLHQLRQWAEAGILQQDIQSFLPSLPRRVAKVIASRGSYTQC